MSKSNGVKVEPIGAEEYILICKKVADKLSDAVGTENDPLAQSFISITNTVYAKLHKLTPEEFDEVIEIKETEPIVDGGPRAGETEDIRT